MTRILWRAVPALLLMTQAALAQLPAQISGQPLPSLAPLVKEVSPAVVSIATKGTVAAPTNPLMEDPFFRRFFGFPEQEQRRQFQSLGSGVIVDADKGYIVTNHHVVENAEEIQIIMDDDRTVSAKLVGSDQGTDIAVLQMDEFDRVSEIRLGDSNAVEVGDFVLAIGNPFGLEHTVTSGIVSALGRTGISREGYEDFIQTDASINPGNSGGALVNLRGELIGINSAIFSNSGGNIGIGFAIPVNIAKAIMAQLIEYGEVRRGLLGVSISDFNAETAKAYGMQGTEQGALVQEVVAGSAAEKAGIEVGDVIVGVDGDIVKNAGDLRNKIGLRRSGDQVRIDVMREGKRRQVRATLDQVSAVEPVAAADIHPGLEGAEFSDYAGDGSRNGAGVRVDAVAPNSPAAFAGLRPNDVILAVNRTRVRSLEDLRAAAEGQAVFVIQGQRGSRRFALQIR